MANITMSLDDDLVKKVRKIAVERDTTLTGLVRTYLTRVARLEEQRKEAVITELSNIMNHSRIRVGDRKWSRADLHER